MVGTLATFSLRSFGTEWCRAPQRHETVELGQQATGVGIAAAICGEPRRPTNHPCENERAGCKSPHPHLSEGRGEVFFLDILFYRDECNRDLVTVDPPTSSVPAENLSRI